MELIKLYIIYVRLFFKSRAEYRASFFWGIIANFYSYFITYALFWFLLERFKSIDGWGFSEISILYIFNILTYAISGTLFWHTVYFLEQQVISGDLDRLFIRPIGIIPQLICQGFGYTFLGQILVSSLFLVNALRIEVPTWTVFEFVYLGTAVIGAVLLQSTGVLLTGSLSFWFYKSTSFGKLLYYDLRQFINYPLSIYPRFLQVVLTFVLPWAFINYYPSLFLTKHPYLISNYVLCLIAPLIGFITFYLSIRLFYRGVRRYISTGS